MKTTLKVLLLLVLMILLGGAFFYLMGLTLELLNIANGLAILGGILLGGTTIVVTCYCGYLIDLLGIQLFKSKKE